MCDATWVTAQLSLPFPGGKWVEWKNMKTWNISGTKPTIFFVLSPCVWENKGPLNRIMLMTRATFNNCADISAIIGPILVFNRNDDIVVGNKKRGQVLTNANDIRKQMFEAI